MRIDERERRIARERDALPRRPDGGRRRRGRTEVELAGQREHAGAIDMRLDEIGDSLEPRFERLRLPRLHQTQMAFGQRDVLVARQSADNRNTQRLYRLDDEAAMALASDPIDDDAGDFEPLVICRAALDDRGGELGLGGGVEWQDGRAQPPPAPHRRKRRCAQFRPERRRKDPSRPRTKRACFVPWLGRRARPEVWAPWPRNQD